MRFLALLAAAAVLCSGQAFAAGYGDFSGRWRNNDPGTRDITRLRITFDRTGNLDVRAWGQCHPTDCDWGRVDAIAYSPSPALDPTTSATEIIAVFNPGFARKTLVLTARPGNRLYYSLYTRFSDSSGRRPYVRRGLLRRHGGYWADWPPGGGPGGGGWPPGGPGGGPGGPGYDDDEGDSGWPGGGPGGPGGGPGGPGGGPGGPGGDPGGPGGGPGGPGGGLSFAEDCVNFNWNNVEARFVSGEWKVVEGSHWMLSFGARAAEAARAANIIRHYRFTQHCFIGRPNPAMHYWKRGSGVPSGGIPGDDCTRNDPDNTEARRVSGSWKLVDDSHWVLDFGPRGGEARQAEEVVKQYRLNRQCFVGRPNPSMVYWLSE